MLSAATRVHHAARRRGCVAAADAGAAADDANGWRSGPCPMLMTKRKIISQTMIGNETRPIKAKLRNASCLWETHQSNLWVLDFIRRSPPRPWNIVQHDCGNLNDQRRNNRPARKCGLLLKTGSCSCCCSGPNQQHDFSAGEFSIVIRVRIIQVDPPGRAQLLSGFGEENGGTQRRSFSNTISVADSAADHAFCATGSQMLILRVSGIRNRLSTKHTAGTAIG